MGVRLVWLPEVAVLYPRPGEDPAEFIRLWAAAGHYARVSPHALPVSALTCQGSAVRTVRPILCSFGKNMDHSQLLAALAKHGLRPCGLGLELVAVGSVSETFLGATKRHSLLAVAAGEPASSVAGYPQAGTIFCHPSQRSLGVMNQGATIRADMWAIGIPL